MLTTENNRPRSRTETVLDGTPLDIRSLSELIRGTADVAIDDRPEVLQRIARAVSVVERAVEEGQPVYGVTTGFGGMADQPVPSELAADSQCNLLSFLAAGAGDPIDPRHVRGAMVLRANVLLRGHSGVRYEIIERLAAFLRAGATPVVRELGSIGASGDLVPLSTIARAITGENRYVKVQLRDEVVDGPTALARLGLKPLKLQAKEGLAIVNGTSFSSAVAANCVAEARRLLAVTMATQAMMLRALRVQLEPFERFVHQCKPHPGQVWSAEIMCELLRDGPCSLNGARRDKPDGDPPQDRYSLRCLPQYMGPIVEGIARTTGVVETEMNAVSDNPLIDAENERFYQSGNFLGQYIGMAMDDLRRYIGLAAKHLDVQIATLVTPEFSNGLPTSLRGNEQLPYNMGLKGLQITGNSIMPMLTYFGNPLVEHYPTHAEQFNQNINGLSWGAAHLAWKSVEYFQHYLAVALIAAVQAVDLRTQAAAGHHDGRQILSATLEPFYTAFYEVLGSTPGKQEPYLFNDGDQWLEEQLAALQHDFSTGGVLIEAVEPILRSFDEQNFRAAEQGEAF